MKPGTHIIIVFLGSIIAAAYLYVAAPTAATVGVPAIILFAGSVIAVLSKLTATQTVATEAKNEAGRATAQSQENAHSIAAVAAQTGHGLDTITQKVNGHQTAQMNEIRALRDEVASLKQERAVKANDQAHAATDKAEIISAMQTAVSDAAALAPPVESAPTGTTIAGPVTITPLGDTTIVMPEPSS